MAKKYIDAEKLKSIIKVRIKERKEWMKDIDRSDRQDQLWSDLNGEDMSILQSIDSLQQDETQVDRMLCSQVWWEDQGWIMIPPDATIEGIDSLLRQIKKKLQQQPEVDLEKEYQEFCKDYPFPWSSQYVNREYIDELCLSVARHFYELARQKYEK